MTAGPRRWLRRARPLLGTLVEVGVQPAGDDGEAAFEAAYAAVGEVQRLLSRFDPASEVSRFHALACGHRLRISPLTRDVLFAARELHSASAGAFDISLGTAPQGWHCSGLDLHKTDPAVRLDLGGIAKGHAVDLAVRALQDCGCRGGWVNAGGDLRAFGDAEVPVLLRDERSGGVRAFATVCEGAFATSHYGAGSRSQLAPVAGRPPVHAHVSVCAPRCLHADALTKVVASSGDAASPVLTRYDAAAWLH